MLVATTNEIAGYRIVRHVGMVRGVIVRSRSIVGSIGASLQSLLGGNISLYTALAERAPGCVCPDGDPCRTGRGQCGGGDAV